MVMKNLIYLGLGLFLLTTTTAEAQIFKKLKKQIEKKAVDTETKEDPDKTHNMRSKQPNISNFPMGMDMVDPAEIPDSYDFDWEYTLNMETPEGKMLMVYHIKENAPYVGIKIPQADNMFTVIDNKKDLTVLYMDSKDSKMVMATRNQIYQEEMELEDRYKDMEFKEVDTKMILGYECRGYRSENDEHIFEFYVTDEAGVSFRDIFQENQKQIPKGLNADWLKDGTGLMMEMQMRDKKNPKKNVSMTCTGIQKKPFTVKTSEYQSMGAGGR